MLFEVYWHISTFIGLNKRLLNIQYFHYSSLEFVNLVNTSTFLLSEFSYLLREAICVNTIFKARLLQTRKMLANTSASSWIKYSDWHWGCSDSVINIRESSLSPGPRSTPMESPLVVGPGDPFDPGYTELIRVSLGLLRQDARAKGGVMGYHPRLKWRRVLTYNRLFNHSFFRTLYIYIIYTSLYTYVYALRSFQLVSVTLYTTLCWMSPRVTAFMLRDWKDRVCDGYAWLVCVYVYCFCNGVRNIARSTRGVSVPVQPVPERSRRRERSGSRLKIAADSFNARGRSRTRSRLQ